MEKIIKAIVLTNNQVLVSQIDEVGADIGLSLIHISEPTRPLYISYAVFCLKKKNLEIYVKMQFTKP